MHICSENNFPTAAGLASSAAGYACLVYALASLYEIEGDITTIARRGSGSACRSILGGWVSKHQRNNSICNVKTVFKMIKIKNFISMFYSIQHRLLKKFHLKRLLKCNANTVLRFHSRTKSRLTLRR